MRFKLTIGENSIFIYTSDCYWTTSSIIHLTLYILYSRKVAFLRCRTDLAERWIFLFDRYRQLILHQCISTTRHPVQFPINLTPHLKTTSYAEKVATRCHFEQQIRPSFEGKLTSFPLIKFLFKKWILFRINYRATSPDDRLRFIRHVSFPRLYMSIVQAKSNNL